MSSAAPPPFDDPAGTWNRRFAEPGFLFGTEPNEWLARHAHRLPPGGQVLCVADGEGRNSVWLAARGLRVQAFDIAGTGVEKARRFAGERGVEVDFTVAGVDDYAWPADAFDAVAAIFVQFADPPMRARLFDRMVRALRPGGTLLLHGYTPRQVAYGTGGPPRESHMYTPELLREAFAGLRIDVLEEYEAELAEGTAHKGRSALIGLVATRPAA